jgi:hypothetical protein
LMAFDGWSFYFCFLALVLLLCPLLFQIQPQALTKQSHVNHPLISTAKNPVLQKGQITF